MTAAARAEVRYAADLGERVLSSFVEGALASLPLTFGVAQLHTPAAIAWTALAGGLTGVAALLKGLVAKAVGDGHTAALLSTRIDTPKPDDGQRALEDWVASLQPERPAAEVWTKNQPAEPAPELPVGPHPVAGTGGPAVVRPRPKPHP